MWFREFSKLTSLTTFFPKRRVAGLHFWKNINGSVLYSLLSFVKSKPSLKLIPNQSMALRIFSFFGAIFLFKVCSYFGRIVKMRALVLHVTTQLGFWWQKDPLNLVVTNIEGDCFLLFQKHKNNLCQGRFYWQNSFFPKMQ